MPTAMPRVPSGACSAARASRAACSVDSTIGTVAPSAPRSMIRPIQAGSPSGTRTSARAPPACTARTIGSTRSSATGVCSMSSIA